MTLGLALRVYGQMWVMTLRDLSDDWAVPGAFQERGAFASGWGFAFTGILLSRLHVLQLRMLALLRRHNSPAT